MDEKEFSSYVKTIILPDGGLQNFFDSTVLGRYYSLTMEVERLPGPM